MYSIKYKLETKSSILISRSSGERNTVFTFDYFPGTTILGMFTSKYLSKINLNKPAHQDDNFRKWFLDGKLIFTNAIISGINDPNYPVPKSVLRKKENENKLVNAIYAEFSELQKTKSLADSFGNISGETIFSEKIEKSLNFHMMRNDKNDNTETIFNYEAINQNQSFSGEIIGEEEDLEKFIELLGSETEYSAGRSKNSQYGNVTVKFINNKPEEYKTNIKNFNDNDTRTLTFISPVILYNKNGESVVDVKLLEEYLKENINTNIEIEKAFISQSFFENFISIWKLKKPSEICFDGGSTFKISGLNEKDIDKMELLVLNGIGERKSEGFGRIIWDYNANVTKIIKSKSDKSIRNHEKMPELVKEIIKQYLIGEVERKIISYAIITCKKLKNDLNTSFCSRMIGIFSNSNNYDTLKNEFEEIKGPVKKKLENIHKKFDENESVNLKEYILNIKNIRKYYENVELEDVKISADKEFNLYKLYFLIFFTSLRKIIQTTSKKGEKKND